MFLSFPPFLIFENNNTSHFCSEQKVTESLDNTTTKLLMIFSKYIGTLQERSAVSYFVVPSFLFCLVGLICVSD